jgi:hypothetical protein
MNAGLLGIPPTVTNTVPVEAPAGTRASISTSDQRDIVVAGTPEMVRVLVPWVEPKALPDTLMGIPARASDGVTLASNGRGAGRGDSTMVVLLLPLQAGIPIVANAISASLAPARVGQSVLVFMDMRIKIPLSGSKLDLLSESGPKTLVFGPFLETTSLLDSVTKILYILLSTHYY